MVATADTGGGGSSVPTPPQCASHAQHPGSGHTRPSAPLSPSAPALPALLCETPGRGHRLSAMATPSQGREPPETPRGGCTLAHLINGAPFCLPPPPRQAEKNTAVDTGRQTPQIHKNKVTVGNSDIPPKQNRARHSRTWPKKILKSLAFLRLIYSRLDF